MSRKGKTTKARKRKHDPKAKPTYIRATCDTCKSALQQVDTMDGMKAHVPIPEEWMCPACMDRVYLDTEWFRDMLKRADDRNAQIKQQVNERAGPPPEGDKHKKRRRRKDVQDLKRPRRKPKADTLKSKPKKRKGRK